jgi:hypothetical protein
MVNDQGYTYDPVARKIGYDDASEYFQGLTAISSVGELRQQRENQISENIEDNSRN